MICKIHDLSFPLFEECTGCLQDENRERAQRAQPAPLSGDEIRRIRALLARDDGRFKDFDWSNEFEALVSRETERLMIAERKRHGEDGYIDPRSDVIRAYATLAAALTGRHHVSPTGVGASVVCRPFQYPEKP